jgi:hypothetical protein
VLEALLSNLKSLPIVDIVHNIGYEVNKHSSNKCSLLGGDIVILGMELEKKILYVVLMDGNFAAMLFPFKFAQVVSSLNN